MALQIYLFGEFRVLRGQKAIKFRDSTTRALFVYLVTRPNRSASRSELIRDFWGDLPDATARRKLSLYLTYLRTALGNGLDNNGSTVGLGPTDRRWVDVEEFQKLVTRAEGLLPAEDERERYLQEALTLYRRGEFFAGYDGEWCLDEQERLKEIYIRALRGLAEYYREQREWDSAIAYAREWQKTSPVTEAVHKELMLLQWAKNDPQAALRQYEEYARLCEAEGLRPSNHVLDLHNELLRLVGGRPNSSHAYKKRFVFDVLMAQAKQYEHEGRRREQEIVLDRAYQIAQDLRDNALLASVQNKRSVLYWRTSRYDTARESAAEALRLHRKLGNKAGEVESRVYLGYCEYHQGRFKDALKIFQQAHRVAQNLGDKGVLSKTHNSLGMAYMNLGKPREAAKHFEQSLALQQGSTDEREEASSLSNLGAAYHTSGDLGKALSCYQRALASEEAAGHKWGVAANLTNIAALYDDIGEYEEARKGYEQASQIFHELKDAHAEVSTLINLATTLSHLDRPKQALKLYEHALPMAREIGDREGEIGTLIDQGSCYLEMKEYARAEEQFTQALELSRTSELRSLEARAHSCLADLYLARREPEKAFKTSQQAIKTLGDAELMDSATIWFSHFKSAQAASKPSVAREALRKAHSIVQHKARAISDTQLRESFLKNVKTNREIVAAWERLRS